MRDERLRIWPIFPSRKFKVAIVFSREVFPGAKAKGFANGYDLLPDLIFAVPV
jgi:hypothetical protein